LLAIGSAEGGAPQIDTELWSVMSNGLQTGTESLLVASPCQSNAETFDSLEDFVGDNHPPVPETN
jgi:hypothetical protein